MTVEMGHRGGATDVMMRQLLKDQGMEPDQDVRVSYTGGPMHDPAGVARAFKGGHYGPAMLAIDREATGFVQEGYPVLADLRELYPPRHDRVTAANVNFSKEQPDVLKGFLKGMFRGCRFVLELRNRERFTQMIRKADFLTTEREERSFADLFNGWQDRVSRDLSLPLDGIELILNEQKKAGKVTPSFDLGDVLRLDALKRAQLDLTEGIR